MSENRVRSAAGRFTVVRRSTIVTGAIADGRFIGARRGDVGLEVSARVGGHRSRVAHLNEQPRRGSRINRVDCVAEQTAR